MEEALSAEVSAFVLEGDRVEECSRAFAASAEALLAAGQVEAGRLASDAVSIGWRCLRAMEALPVPLSVYEREAGSYWGVRKIGELFEAFERFTLVVEARGVRGYLQEALDALSIAMSLLREEDPPLWLGLANLCVDSNRPRELVFPTRARLKMFSQALLARLNASEDDLRGLGVSLRWLASQTDDVDGPASGLTGVDPSIASRQVMLVGLPGRDASRYLESFFQCRHPAVLIWPHQDEVLKRRLRMLSGDLALTAQALGGLLPTLEGLGGGREYAVGQLRVPAEREAATCRPRGPRAGTPSSGPLWQRPSAADAIASLFGGASSVDEDSNRSTLTSLDESRNGAGGEDMDSTWVDSAIKIGIDSGQYILLPIDERVNVIVHGRNGPDVEQRYVRAVMVGDEILFIQGQRRQSLYDLLVSRVHRNPVIAQYLALVRRWQDSVTQAYVQGERARTLDADRFLLALQAKGSAIRTVATIRAWVRGLVLAPSDAEDIRRVGEVLGLPFVVQYFLQIHRARGRLWGLHIQLSAKLNRWLASDEVGAVAGEESNVIDAELGLTVDDFRHSLLRLRVASVTSLPGPFFRPNLGQLQEDRS